MEWKKLVDKTLGTNFDAPQYDPKKGRDKLVKAIDTAGKQHTDGSTKAPNRAWKLGGNNAIRFVPKLNGNEILLDDGHPVFVPAEHFQTFLGQLKSSVQAGDLDKEIKAALEGDAPVKSASSTGTAKPKGEKEKFPKHLRTDWDNLSDQERRTLGTRWGRGRNPDNSLRAEKGDQPMSAIAPSSNAK